jgi:ArsR family transcriptional regulator, arsenate/arsenite/antimonite-responsive transcriptional repressor / arsenate reductase (thioredoxin)
MQSTQQNVAPELYKLLANDVRWQILAALTHSDLRVQEIVATVDKPINLVSYHLKLLRNQEIVHERRSSADGRDIYYSLDLVQLDRLYRHSGAQLHPGLAAGQMTPEQVAHPRAMRVLFVCTQNRARSQMAEGILRHLGGGQVEVQSAGVRPGIVHPLAIQALGEMGIDISQQRSKHVDELQGQAFDQVITVCDQVREQCPVFPGEPDLIHWSIEDPIAAVDSLEDTDARRTVFAKTAQALAARIRYLLMTEATLLR